MASAVSGGGEVLCAAANHPQQSTPAATKNRNEVYTSEITHARRSWFRPAAVQAAPYNPCEAPGVESSHSTKAAIKCTNPIWMIARPYLVPRLMKNEISSPSSGNCR